MSADLLHFPAGDPPRRRRRRLSTLATPVVADVRPLSIVEIQGYLDRGRRVFVATDEKG